MCSIRFLIAGPLMLLACAVLGRNVRVTRAKLCDWQSLVCFFSSAAMARSLGRNSTCQRIRRAHHRWHTDLVPAARDVCLSRRPHFASRNRRPGDGICWNRDPGLAQNYASRFAGHDAAAGIHQPSVLSFSWAIGSVLSRKWQMKVDPLVATGWEMVFASVAHTALALVDRAIPSRGLQSSRSDGGALSRGLRLMDRLHRLCLAAQTCAHAESRDLRLRQSHRCRDPRTHRAT